MSIIGGNVIGKQAKQTLKYCKECVGSVVCCVILNAPETRA